MVQVHTAAALPTGPANINHPLAFLAAAIGGMAAPLFVTASGFGIHISASKKSRDARGWVGWIIPRALVLVLFQVVVNLLFHVNHGGSFHATTPGVLTLFAASAIIAPFTLKFGSYARASLLVALLIWPTLFPGYIGSDLNWSERIASDGLVEWSERCCSTAHTPFCHGSPMCSLAACSRIWMTTDSERRHPSRLASCSP